MRPNLNKTKMGTKDNTSHRPPAGCRLGECLEEEGYDIKRAAEALEVDKKTMESWVKGRTKPGRATMEKVACWFARSVRSIWPSHKARTNWKQRFSLLNQRLATVSYRDEPGLYSRLCSERALASVKIYSADRWAYIKELEKNRRNQPMLQSEFAQITELNKKPTFC